jgi:hypothetical protein
MPNQASSNAIPLTNAIEPAMNPKMENPRFANNQ